MSAHEQASSDPLPYVQVDRAAFEKASLLAPQADVTRNHALGGLVSFWQHCADRRRLEKVLLNTPEGETPALVFNSDELMAIFEITVTPAKKLTPLHLEVIGLVEKVDDDRFRVRGMSRAFKPIMDSASWRDLAVKAGKASAAARKAKNGTAQPRGGKGSKPVEKAAPPVSPAKALGSATSSEPTEPQPNTEPNGSRTDNRTGDRAEPNPSGQRSAVSDIEDLYSTSQAHRAGSPEVKNSLGEREMTYVPDDIPPDPDVVRREASAAEFVSWAASLDASLASPGAAVHEWARAFWAKYDPHEPALVKRAFSRFLLACADASVWGDGKPRVPGWGLWLQEPVWRSRWDEVRAARGAR